MGFHDVSYYPIFLPNIYVPLITLTSHALIKSPDKGTDFIKLPREEALNRKVQRQRVHIPTFGPVPLVESTPIPTQSTEPVISSL
jgi:hypothetical protein